MTDGTDNQPTLNESLQALTGAAADEAMSAADEHDAKFKQGGTLSSEEEAKAADQPSEPIEEESDGQPDAEPQAVDWNSFMGGKYAKHENPLQEAEKSLYEAGNALTQERNTRAQLEEQNQQLQALIQKAFGDRQMPSERDKERVDYRARLDAVGVDAEAVEALVNERAGALIQQTFNPIFSELRANEINMENVPGFTAETPRVIQKWLADSQNTAVRTRYEAAMAEAQTPELRAMANEWAFRQMQSQQAAEVSGAVEANKEVRNEIAKQTKQDAGTGTRGKTTARENLSQPNKEDKYIEREDFDKLKALGKAGYGQKVAGKLISLPDDLFD